MYSRMCACMYVCVIIYVCRGLRMRARICVRTRLRVYVCTGVRMYVCTYVRMYVCTYVRMYVCTYVLYVCTVRMYVCRGEDLISYPLRKKEDNFHYGHGSQLLLCTHIGHVIILIMP